MAVIDAQRAYRKRLYLAGGSLMVDAEGSRRRVRALAAIGWSFAELGRRLGGVTGEAIGNMTLQRVVHRDTAARVSELFEALCMTPGPSTITRRRAEAKGWAPPLAYDDIDVDEVSSTEVERAHAEALWEDAARRKRASEARRRERHRARRQAA